MTGMLDLIGQWRDPLEAHKEKDTDSHGLKEVARADGGLQPHNADVLAKGQSAVDP